MGKTLRAMEGGKTQYGPMISVLVPAQISGGGHTQDIVLFDNILCHCQGLGERDSLSLLRRKVTISGQESKIDF